MGVFRSPATARDKVQHDVGTLWTMERGESTARCVLRSMSDGLELRVLMDGTILKFERCDHYDEAFALAERWRGRLMDRGWMWLADPKRTRTSA
jgi:hypothetical protein